METLKRNIINEYELAVLNQLNSKRLTEESNEETSDVKEISLSTGIRDNDEVLRALYTLEGKNFVAPEPEGSFTSSNWKITDTGIRALELSDIRPRAN